MFPRSDSESVELSGQRPEQVARYCQRVRDAEPDERTSMIYPLVQLDCSTCAEETVELVEDTLYFAVFREERPRQHP